MDASVSLTIGSILTFVGFLFQAGLTIGAIAFSHGQLNQRVRSIEEKQKENSNLATSVTRLETEMEVVSREIKGLRNDLRLNRSELRNEMRDRQPPQRRTRPYDFEGARDWVTEDEQ